MSKRTIALLAGTIFLQTAAFAADKECDSKATSSTSQCEKAEKKSESKKISHSGKGGKKKVASAQEAQVGAY